MRADTVDMAVALERSVVEEPVEVDDVVAPATCASRLVAAVIASVVSGLVSALTIAPVFRAKFGPIDDHQPLAWMGRDSRLGWTEIPEMLFADTEVGAFGGDGRFRPSYFAARLVQTAAFGDDVAWWYLSVLVMFAVTCGAAGYSFGRWITTGAGVGDRLLLLAAISVVASLLVMALPAWRGIVVRLGPSEQLGMMAVALVVLALTELGLGGDERWWWLASVAAAVAVMSKETLVGVGVVTIVFAWIGTSGPRRWQVFAVVGSAVGLVGAASARVAASGQDVYGRSTGRARGVDALEALASSFVATDWRRSTLLILVALGSFLWASLPSDRERRWMTTAIICSVGVVLVDAVASGGVYSPVRYQILIQFVALAQFAAAGALCLAAVRRSTTRRWVIALSTVGFVVAFHVVGFLADTRSSLDQLNLAAQTNRELTERFDQLITETVATVDDGSAFAVTDVTAADYEVTMATVQEVWRRAKTPTTGFILIDEDQTDADGLLGSRLSELARVGDAGRHIRRVNELDADAGLTCVVPNAESGVPHICDDVFEVGRIFLR